MEPNLRHIAFDALPHDFERIAGMRRDDDAIERAGDRDQVRIATHALDLGVPLVP
jgi:hypothetical protein